MYKENYEQLHLRVPTWLMQRINTHARSVGQSASSEIRRALVEAFGDREGPA